MNNFRADLHCHTYFSDGSDSPEELIDLAIKIGLSGLSITDHDTMKAYERAMPYAQALNFPLLTGIECSAMHKQESVHILGYGYSLDSQELSEFCRNHKRRRKERNSAILANLRALKINITEEDLAEEAAESASFGRLHIAKILVKKGVVSSVRSAFNTYIGEGKPAYDPGEAVSVEETINVIHQAGGLAVIAHPHLIKRSSTVRALKDMDFDGIEGYYATLRYHQEQKWIALAQDRGWFVTGGSDYHGSNRKQSLLGSSWVDQVTFERLCSQGYSKRV